MSKKSAKKSEKSVKVAPIATAGLNEVREVLDPALLEVDDEKIVDPEAAIIDPEVVEAALEDEDFSPDMDVEEVESW